MKNKLKNSNRILIVDDNVDIHEDFRKVLQPIPDQLDELKTAVFGAQPEEISTPIYEIDSAYQGEQATELVEKALKEGHPYFLVFVDIRMPPGWDGLETVEKIWRIDLDIQTVICTAYSDYSWQEMLGKLGCSDRLLILKKPFDSIEVRQITCALQEKWRLEQESRHQVDYLQSRVEERTAEIRGTLEATTDGIVVVSKFAKISDYNQNFLKIWENLRLEESSIEEVMATKDPARLIEFIGQNAYDGKNIKASISNLFFNFDDISFSDLRMELRLKNGKIVELYTRPLLLKKENIGRVLSLRDVTEARYFEEQLAFQATHDLLTYLPNRVLLVDRLEQAIHQAKRTKTQIAIIYLDLDRFMVVNDSLGHNFGDSLLRAVAERLLLCIREVDTLCRVGGDEFVLIMPELHEESLPLFTIKKIQEAIREPFVISGHPITLTGSFGVSFFPQNGADADELLKNADVAMYRAKSLGKNTFHFYEEEMNAQMNERLTLEQNLYMAYKLGELLLYYQPIINTKTQEIIGTEALLRWQHPQLGLISPLKFISVAEDTGLILKIGEWAFRTACEQNLLWQKNGLPFLPIAVNLSGYQVKNIESLRLFEQILDELHYDGHNLVLELTENILMQSDEAIKEKFQDLRKRGISFAIDDFGTGYSNLNYFIHFSISKLKIDKSFIDNLDSNPKDRAIIQAIISMAHRLNISVIAEGVETENQYKFLLENHCDEIQGFYFSKPLDAKSYSHLLRDGLKLSAQT